MDRDSLLNRCASASAAIARGEEIPDKLSALGFNPWNMADVARTALAWGTFQWPEADGDILLRLCNMNVQLADEEARPRPASSEVLGRVLARLFFEQFPGQRSVLAEVARTILLFGSASEHPQEFSPEAMGPGWFERIAGGLTLDEYVESVFLISVGAQNNGGTFTPDWLEGPGFQELEDMISFDAMRRTFSEHLVISVSAFKEVNRGFQDPVPSTQKKFAFNPLTDKPFVEGVAPLPIAPWCQAIIAKALPPAIYHLGVRALGGRFSRDLGEIFQHYVGRQLELINDERSVLPEVRYGPKGASVDSCDWFLDLPGLLVLIECKARQPIESLRTGGTDWLRSVEDSIGKGIAQLNRSNREIDAIRSSNLQIDTTKRRVGIVVTLEPFFLNQNWLIRDQLAEAEFPVGVVSISEMETLALLSADELALALLGAAESSEGGVMLLSPAIDSAAGRENPLLVSTWESIGLFGRAQAEDDRLTAVQEPQSQE